MVWLRQPDTDISHEQPESDVSEGEYFGKDYFRNAHFLTDVLAAIFFGVTWLVFCPIATKPMRSRMVSTTGLPFISESAVVRVESAKESVQTLLR
jgi:hypothetical protein